MTYSHVVRDLRLPQPYLRGMWVVISYDRIVPQSLHKRQVQSTLSKTDTFGTGSKCPSWRGVRLIESQIKGVKKGRDQLQVSVLQRCPSYRGVR